MDHEDGDGDGAGLGDAVDGDSEWGMEKTSRGGFRWRFPPPIFSDGSLLSLCFLFLSCGGPLSKNVGGLFI